MKALRLLFLILLAASALAACDAPEISSPEPDPDKSTPADSILPGPDGQG